MSRSALDRLERVLGTTTDAIERERHDQRILDLLADNLQRPEVGGGELTEIDVGPYEDHENLETYTAAIVAELHKQKDPER